MDERFISSFPEKERRAVLRARDAGVDGCFISGIPCFFRGTLPDRSRSVLFASYAGGRASAHELYQSALESSLSGLDAVNAAESIGSGALVSGCEDGEGRLYTVTRLPLMEYERRYPERLRRIMRTGGGLLSPGLSAGSREASHEIALALSRLVLASPSGPFLPAIIQSAVDKGHDVFLLRSSLVSSAARKLMKDGCPVVSSFSGIYACPEVIAYEDAEGRYGFLEKDYSIARADGTD